MTTEHDEAAKVAKVIEGKKIQAFDNMRMILFSMDAQDLKHCGYKTKEEACLKIMDKTQTQIETLMREFEKRFPLR